MLILISLSALAMALLAWHGPMWQAVCFWTADWTLGYVIYCLWNRRSVRMERCVPRKPPSPREDSEDQDVLPLAA